MLLDDLSTRLTAMGLVASGYTVVKGTLPATPDKVIALREGGGIGPRFFFGGGADDDPIVQLVARGEPYDGEDPRSALYAIYAGIMDWGAFVVGGQRYQGVTPLQPPFPLQRDKNERAEIAFNLMLHREVVA